MPRFLAPRKSIQHRVAAIALYRALLLRCSSAPLPDDDRVSLRNAIRNKFRKNRHIQSSYQLGTSFKAGYETLDYLDASITGDAASSNFISRTISALPRGLTRKGPTPRPPLPLSGPPKERLACLPPEKAVLNVRPYAKVSGPRHVPVLAAANGIPFLRLQKPQPPALSRIIRQKLERRIILFDQKTLLVNWWLPMCRREDEWDALINEQLKKREDNVLWTSAVHQAERENTVVYDTEMEKYRRTTRQMQKIVESETKLALKEGQIVVRGRTRRPIRVIKP